jgi:tetratricopeptide (TPR) repeat protein
LNRRYPQFIDLFAMVGRPERARVLLEEFRALFDERTLALPGSRNGARRLEADIALAENRAADAVSLLRAVRDDNGQCPLCDLAALGNAYDRAENADSAIAYYERYLETPGQRLGVDWNWLGIALRRLGQLHEARGNRERAATYYGRFVDLWQDADAELQPYVREAREAMTRLVGEGGPR